MIGVLPVFGGREKASARGRRLLTFWEPYSGMVVSGVACTWGSGAGGSWTCTG
jgi:hypothetical protein